MQLLVISIFSVLSVFTVRYLITLNISLEKIFIIFFSFFIVFISFVNPSKSILFIIFSMLLSPEIEVGAVPGRSVVVRYDDIFLIVIFITWLVRTAIFKKEYFIIETPLNLPLFIYTSIYVLSTLLGIIRGDINWKKSFFFVLKYTEYFMLYIMSVNILYEEKDLNKFIKSSIFVLLCVIVYSFYYYINSTGELVRTTAPFEAPLGKPDESEPASLGGYYIIWFFLLLGYISEVSDIKKVLLIMFLLAVMYVSFILTFSRASYVALAFGLLVFVFAVRKKKLFFIMSFILVLVLTLISPDISGKIKQRITYTYKGSYAVNPVMTPFGVVYLEDSAYARYKNLKDVIALTLPRHPLLGKGITGVGLGDNQYVLLFGETGIFGFLSFWWFIFTILYMSRKIYIFSEKPFDRAVGIGVFCATVSLLIQGFGVNTFIIVRIMEPYWFCIAIMTLRYIDLFKNEDKKYY